MDLRRGPRRPARDRRVPLSRLLRLHADDLGLSAKHCWLWPCKHSAVLPTFRDGGFETPYRLRKQVVEPVFGQIKQARGFRQFLLRGLEKVRAEWAMICTAHNLLKLFTLAKAA
jgi:hypothetical protein